MNVSSARTSPVQSTQQATQSQKTSQAREQTRQAEPQPKPVQVQQPKPVVNTQGQTTGRMLNVTA